MTRKVLLVVGLILLLLAFGVWTASGQDGGDTKDQFEEVPITTSATNSVGIGSYVAAEAMGIAAGEDPAVTPAQAMILPYGIIPDLQLQKIEDFAQPAPLGEGFTFAWSLTTVPTGSVAALVAGSESAPVAIFMADVEGQYDLSLTSTDPNGNAATATWTVYASTYLGVGGMTSAAPQYPQCGTCHADKGKAWYGTAHATMFTRSIDGGSGDHYGPNCISCHTTGFNNRPEAVNGGFDDIVLDAGWLFPTELKPGNWDALAQEYPQVAAMANIQCESCHGPGKLHTQGNQAAIGVSLNEGTCAQCHAEGPYHIFPQQWVNSAHGNAASPGFLEPIGPDEQECVRCHSGVGFIDYVNGVPEEKQRNTYQPITCAVCHDPHNATNPKQLRVYDIVTLPNGFEVTSAGPAALCMTCHNVRRAGGAEGQVESALETQQFSTPHQGNNQAELLNATGGYTWGAVLPTSTHANVVAGTCVGCHMGSTPGMDDNGTPEDPSDDKPLPGHNEIGQHSFAMVNADGIENVAVCQRCHDGATSFAFDASQDYDGDGKNETVQEEVSGLRDALWGALEAAGVTQIEERPGFKAPENADENIYGALWNYYFTQAEGTPVHNFRYSIALLQLSYEKVSGQPVPNATILQPKS